MSFGLSNRGEELYSENDVAELEYEFSLYLDNTDIDADGQREGDDLGDQDDMTDVTTEPNITRSTKSPDAVTQVDGDYGFEDSVFLNTEPSTAKVDGVLIIEPTTDNIIGRAKLQDPYPAPYQDLTGVNKIEIDPQITID